MALVTLDDFRPRRRRNTATIAEPLQLCLEPGELALISGPEESGKTDVLRAIVGLLRHHGEAQIFGGPIGSTEARRRTGFGPERRPFLPGLRVAEMVALVGSHRGADRPAIADTLSRCGLDEHRSDDPLRTDVEIARRTSLAMAAVGDPDLIVLDDPWESPETVAVLDAARDRGAGVIMATAEPGQLPERADHHLTLSPPASA